MFWDVVAIALGVWGFFDKQNRFKQIARICFLSGVGGGLLLVLWGVITGYWQTDSGSLQASSPLYVFLYYVVGIFLYSLMYLLGRGIHTLFQR